MGLPAFRYAKIAAGKGGINQTVNSITVLEYSDVDVISSDLFLNHEMCITAFSSIKDDVDNSTKQHRSHRPCRAPVRTNDGVHHVGEHVHREKG